MVNVNIFEVINSVKFSIMQSRVFAKIHVVLEQIV